MTKLNSEVRGCYASEEKRGISKHCKSSRDSFTENHSVWGQNGVYITLRLCTWAILTAVRI